MTQSPKPQPAPQTTATKPAREGTLSPKMAMLAIAGALVVIALVFTLVANRISAPNAASPEQAKQAAANQKWVTAKALQSKGKLSDLPGPDQDKVVALAGGNRNQAEANLAAIQMHFQSTGQQAPQGPAGEPPAFIQEMNRRRAAEGR